MKIIHKLKKNEEYRYCGRCQNDAVFTSGKVNRCFDCAFDCGWIDEHGKTQEAV